MLRPTKHLLYFESKQALTFVPNGWVQLNCRADPKDSGQAPRKTSSTHVKTSICMWKFHGKGKIQFSRCLRRETASTSAYHHLPHSYYLSSLLPSPAAATPWQMHLWFITRASWEGWWGITSQRTPCTGPGQPDEPGIFTTPAKLCFANLPTGSGWVGRRGSRCIENRVYTDQLHPLGGRQVSRHPQRCLYRGI